MTTQRQRRFTLTGLVVSEQRLEDLERIERETAHETASEGERQKEA